jgi:hypothetical protein
MPHQLFGPQLAVPQLQAAAGHWLPETANVTVHGVKVAVRAPYMGSW